MNSIVTEQGYHPEKTEFFGSKFLIGNGYLGYRGTLEEYRAPQLVACTMSGLYDQNGGWREPVNAPDPLCIRAFLNGEALSVMEQQPELHSQSLNLSCGLHLRQTRFESGVEILSRRFASMANKHLLVCEYRVVCPEGGTLELYAGIDGVIWDLNGPHLKDVERDYEGGTALFQAKTIELGTALAVAQAISCGGGRVESAEGGCRVTAELEAGQALTLTLCNALYKGTDPDAADCAQAAVLDAREGLALGFDALLEKSRDAWRKLWNSLDCSIQGDEDADLALRYSIYLLIISTPFHTDAVAVPGRGLSGQVYKGAMFWDTELYMLPMFCSALPDAARNLVAYRIRTLEGARRKAAEYGYRGAFYAWESQETGDDGCTEYNINDVFTGRPIRTYFRDKQIHISADVVYGIWLYYRATGDISLLLEGGAETAFECARFLYSYSYYKSDKARYELVDVTGADEYHERVSNDAYTNFMTKKALETAGKIRCLLAEHYPGALRKIDASIGYARDEAAIADFAARLYVPSPRPGDGLVEQYDGYFGMEDIRPDALKKRILLQNEYLGSPCGIAVQTQVIKQADVVLLQALFPEDYTQDELLANFEYYEPRTEHGSSLSACIYALAAARCGLGDYAYRYFMKTAQLDLTGDYKLYVGDQYIGGTHPAANGGSWMVAVQGFGGLSLKEDRACLSPRLPKRWRSFSFRFVFRGNPVRVELRHGSVALSMPEGAGPVMIELMGAPYTLSGGQTIVLPCEGRL
ncbi:MAG: glycosyl hydrolase family 65 protein [Clostridiaceae bacterium]|nr:glycoside hydrolase family 65 protein [Eubacteriales bacterium]